MNTEPSSLAFFLLLVSICFLPEYAVSDSEYAQNRPPVVFNFGDSNSDTGGFTAGLGLEFPYPYGRIFSGDRPCDGRLIIDFLCEYLGTNYLKPYLNSIDPNFENGVNFAVSGAATFPQIVGFNLNVQIRQFIHFYNRSIHLHSQVGEEGFKNALYTIDIGQNDLSGSFGVLSYAQVIQKIPSFVSAIKDAMWAIYEHGGRNFWVHNTGPLGCLPRELAIRRDNLKNGSNYDEYGCLKDLNEGARIFNTQLHALCKQLQSEMKNSTIVYIDVYSIKYSLIANSTLYGFKNPLMACCGSGGPPYNYNSDKDCVLGGSTACEQERQDISWDGTHYTEAANSIVASKILSTHYSYPPLRFDFFRNNVL